MPAIRIDSLDKYYKPVQRLHIIENWLFWFSVLFSLLILITNSFLITYDNEIKLFYVIVVVAHFLVSAFNEYILLPNAENERRKQLLTNSLNVILTTETTKKFYNNEFEPSIKRLGANIFENSLFGKEISKQMLIRETIKVVGYFLLWFILLLNRSTMLDTILVITQTIFSSEILLHWIRLIILHIRMKNIYSNLFSLYSTESDPSKSLAECKILNEFGTYESSKMLTRILQSPKLFNEMNEELSSEWEKVKTQIGMN